MTTTKEVVSVPGAGDMDDETVYKHLNARHKQDLGLDNDLDFSPFLSKSLVDTMRAYHRRIHLIAVPDQYDHEHRGEN